MILEAKSKPVKFRIRSGGEEHSSLDSLRGNFVWEDIKPLCGNGNQLMKWLDRIDADIAKEYKKIENPADNVLAVYNVLFRKGKAALQTRIDVFRIYVDLKKDQKYEDSSIKSELKSLRELGRSIIPKLTNKEMTNFLDKYSSLYGLYEIEIANKVRNIQNDLTSKELFLAGKVMFESSQNQELAEELIKKASAKGLSDAAEFIKKNFKEDKNSLYKKFYELFSTDKVIKVLKNSWNREVEVKNMVGYSMDEKNIFSFSNTCLSIHKKNRDSDTYSYTYTYGVSLIKEMYQLAEMQFSFAKKTDPLYEEKMFVLSLFDPEIDSALERLKLIGNYPPARYMLERNTKIFVIDHRKFEIGSQKENANHLDFYVANLMRFRQVDHKKPKSQTFPANISTDEDESSDSLDVLYKDNEIMECIRDSWQAKTSINPSSNRGLKNKIFIFSDACLNIVKASWSNLVISQLSSIAENYIGREIKKTDPLRTEKLFVLGLFGRTFDEARSRMIEIENSYPIAKIIARGAANGYNMYGDWESHLYSIRDNRRTENADHLEYFIKNLPKFRKDV